MKRLLTAAAVLLAAFAFDLGAVQVDENNGVWIIETDSYVLHFRTSERAGYSQVFPSTNAGESSIFGANKDRTFYHSANYNGWQDWWAMTEAEEISNANNTLVMKYTIPDRDIKEYVVTATYWDGAPYWKHEVVVNALNDVPSFSGGHEPMCEPKNGLGGKNQYQSWEEPFPHLAVVADEIGYFAMYTEVGTAALDANWGGGDGRMHLIHDNVGVNLKKDASSEPLIYYLATGKGNLDDAHELADQVTEEPALSVDPKNNLSVRWAELKR